MDIEVQDDGPGIPVQYQNELFTPFFRVEQSRNREFGGTRSSVVHAIVLAHAGQIQYENKNHNSLFMIRINMNKFFIIQ